MKKVRFLIRLSSVCQRRKNQNRNQINKNLLLPETLTRVTVEKVKEAVIFKTLKDLI